MADGFWNHHQQPPSHLLPSAAGPTKRPRTDYGLPAGLSPGGMPLGHEMPNYLSRDGDHIGLQAIRDTQSIGSAYDRYLQSKGHSSFGPGEASANFGGGVMTGRSSVGVPGFPLIGESPLIGGSRSAGLDMALDGRGVMGFGGQPPVDPMARAGREVRPLPPDATNTLFIEGLPPDCTKREVAHIFRPFLGYREVRLVSKESKHRGGDPLILCFVDFSSPACAATALSAVQGYKMDEHEPDSNYLRMEFAKFPGPRSGPARGKR